jgi:ribose transport system ATP-binding protein
MVQPMTSSETVPLLSMSDISKTFGSIRALSGVNLSVEAGEIHALMGENGAGKSTLMKILSGAYVPDAGGRILIDGQSMSRGDPIGARKAGIAVIYQELALAPNLSVAQNMFLGIEPRQFGITQRKRMIERAQPILARLNAPFAATDPVSALSLGERQLVEVARALTTDARIIVMDEPTTSLTAHEAERLFQVIAVLKEQGISIVYISHRMEEIYRLADRVTVLRDGAYVGTLSRDELSADRLVSMMVGRDLSSFYRRAHSQESRRISKVLSVSDIGDGKRVLGCSFDAYGGEVLGIAGLVGSGRTELARLIFGADPKTSGSVVLEGRTLTIKEPGDALDAGLAYLTEDRKGLGLFLDMSISENVNIGVIAKDANKGILNFAMAKRRSDEAVSTFGIRASSTAVNVGSLSGGNQQKALIARILATQPKVIFFDEPTRGVDVGAKSEIYRIIDDLASRGIAIIVISSDLPEVIGICDRVLVMREGRLVGEVTPTQSGEILQEDIMALSTGASKAAA